MKQPYIFDNVSPGHALPTTVPEPATMALLLFGGFGLVGEAFKRRNN